MSVHGSVYARQQPDGTYGFATDKPAKSKEEVLLLKGLRKMQVSEETVCAPGKVATLKVSSDGEVKEFERKYPWLDNQGEQEAVQSV